MQVTGLAMQITTVQPGQKEKPSLVFEKDDDIVLTTSTVERLLVGWSLFIGLGGCEKLG